MSTNDPSLALTTTLRSAPVGDTPGIAYAASQQAQPDVAAQAAASLRWGYQTTNQLQAMDSGLQRQAWGGFNQDEQRILSGMGYVAPRAGGFWHTLGHALAHPLSTITGAVSPVLNDLGSPLRAVEHGFRTVYDDLGGRGFGAFPRMLSAHDWAQSWRNTADGEKYMPNAERALGQAGLDPRFHQVAIAAAGGEKMDNLVGQYGPDLVAQATNDPNWAKSIDYLNRSKISVGRFLVDPTASGANRGKVGTILSGGLDGAFDVFYDPANFALGRAAEALKARYAINSSADVARIWESSAVQRAASRMLGHFEEGGRGVAGVIDEFPKLKPFGEDLASWARDNPHTPEALKGFFSDLADLNGTLKGSGTGAFREIPRLGPLGGAKLDVRLGLKDAIDYFAGQRALPTGAVLDRSVTGVGRFLKGMTTLYRKTGVIDLTSEKANPVFEQIGRLALPRAVRDDYLNTFLAGDLGVRHNAYLSMVNDTFHALGSDWEEGLKPTSDLEEYHQSIIGAAKDDLQRPYGVGMDGKANSMVDTTSGPRSFGVREDQFTTTRAIPDPLRLAQAARAERMFGSLGQGWIQSYMRLWKGATLMRIGFPLRVGGEEAMRFILDAGVMPYFKSKFATSAIRDRDLLSYARIGDEFGPLRDYVANRAAWFANNAKVKLSGQWYVRAAELQLDRFGADMLPDGIGAGGFQRKFRASEEPSNLIQTIRDVKTGKLVRYRMQPRGWQLTNDVESWQSELLRSAKDPSFKVALAHDDLQSAQDAVYQLMKSDAWAEYRAKSGMLDALRQNGMSEDQALRDLARRNTETSWSLTHSPSGDALPFRDGLKSGAVPGIDELHNIPLESHPRFVAGENLMPVPYSKFAMLSDWFFRKADHWVNALSREPFYTHSLAESLKDIDGQVKKLSTVIGAESAKTVADDWAIRSAFDKVLPNIHDPELRNVFEQYHQAMLPFWFAKEQFYRRWIRTFVHNPAAARRAQLTMMGLRNTGIIHQDGQGNDVFYVPSLPYMQQAISGVASLLTGTNAIFPVDIPMTGQVKYLNAGLAEGAAPGFGPFVGLSLGLLARRFKSVFGVSTQTIEEKAIGAQGAGRPLWQSFTPTIVNNLYNATIAKEQDSPQVASALTHSVLQLHALGLDPPADASPQERQVFLHRVSVWTRGLLTMRALFGFASPSAPQLDIVADNTRPELLQLMSTLPFDQAITEFIRRHPDEGYLAVFSTKGAPGSDRPLPVTTQAGQWLTDNQAFIDKYGAAAASYFMPQAPGGFDQATWKEELAIGLRIRKSAGDYWQDLQLASDKDIYYRNLSVFRTAYDQTAHGARGQLDANWKEWKSQFLQTRPLMAEWISQGGDRAQTRSQTIGGLQQAADDGQLAPEPARFLRGYTAFQGALQSLLSHRGSQAYQERRILVDNFKTWANSFTDPSVLSMYQTLVEPDMP